MHILVGFRPFSEAFFRLNHVGYADIFFWTCNCCVQKTLVLQRFCVRLQQVQQNTQLLSGCVATLSGHVSCMAAKIMHFKNIIMQKLEEILPEGTRTGAAALQLYRGQEKTRVCPRRLLYLSVTWICAQLHVKGGGTGIFIFIHHGNGLIQVWSFAECG